MTVQQTPKSRARAIVKRYMETPGATLENLVFMEIVREIEAAELRGYEQGLKAGMYDGQKLDTPF